MHTVSIPIELNDGEDEVLGLVEGVNFPALPRGAFINTISMLQNNLSLHMKSNTPCEHLSGLLISNRFHNNNALILSHQASFIPVLPHGVFRCPFHKAQFAGSWNPALDVAPQLLNLAVGRQKPIFPSWRPTVPRGRPAHRPIQPVATGQSAVRVSDLPSASGDVPARCLLVFLLHCSWDGH